MVGIKNGVWYFRIRVLPNFPHVYHGYDTRDNFARIL